MLAKRQEAWCVLSGPGHPLGVCCQGLRGGPHTARRLRRTAAPPHIMRVFAVSFLLGVSRRLYLSIAFACLAAIANSLSWYHELFLRACVISEKCVHKSDTRKHRASAKISTTHGARLFRMSVLKRSATEAGVCAPDCTARRDNLKPRTLPPPEATRDAALPLDAKTHFKKECAAKFEGLLRKYMLSRNCQIKPRETWEKFMRCLTAQETSELDHITLRHTQKLIAIEDDGFYLLHKGTNKRYVHEGQVFGILWEQFAEVEEVEAWSMKVEFVWKKRA